MYHIIKYIAVVVAAKAGFAVLNALKNAPRAPRIIKWGAGMGMALLPVKK